MLARFCLIGALIALPASAIAQTRDAELVVTATRRASALQDVPVAVTPISGAMLEASGARDLQDITSLAPSLQFNVSENETSATARIRGIGTQGSNPGLESAVGVFVDGVYRARNGVALADLGPVAQVEVLRGPQGTLFGRNTSAGLISVRTRGPDVSAFSAAAEAQHGAYDLQRLSVDLNAPVIEDALALRLYAARETREGFLELIDESGNVSHANDRDLKSVRGQLAWRPDETFDLRVIVDASERKEVCCAGQLYDPSVVNGTPFVFPSAATVSVARQGGLGPGTEAQALARLGNGDFSVRRGFADRAYDQRIKDRGVSLEANWDLGFAALTSITAFRDWTFDQGQDGDFVALDLRIRPIDGETGFGFETATQEVRLAGKHGRLDWLLGVYYADETLERRDGQGEGAAYGPYVVALAGARMERLSDALGGVDRRIHDRLKQDSRSLAFFTHNIVSLTERTDLTLGLRYTMDEKDLVANFRTDISTAEALAAQAAEEGLGAFGSCDVTSTPSDPVARSAIAGLRTFYCLADFRSELDGAPRRQSREENEYSGIVSLSHRFSDALMTYASFSRGYKAGGFNLDRDFSGVVYDGINPVSVDYRSDFAPEFVDAYEIGAKTAWFQRALLLNGVIFLSDIENYQLNTFNGLNFQIASVPEATSIGAEVEYFLRGPITGLSAQGGVVYAEAEYGDDPAWVQRTLNPITGAATNFRLPGSRMTNAPLWTVTNAVSYERAIAGGALIARAHVDARYVSSQNTGSNLAPTKIQPGFTLVNGRIGVSAPDERWALELWGRNVFDEEYAQITFDVPLQPGALGAFLGDPRTFGVTVRARY